MPKKLFNKIVIVGVGLIGGSLGMAVKKKHLAERVVGLVRRPKTISEGVKQKAIDKGFLAAGPAIKDADLVVLATPVETIVEIFPKIKRFIKQGCIVIDLGSCKEKIVSVLEKKMPAGAAFVGCHPIAGSEKKGVNFAQPELFKNTPCIITPTPRTNRAALAKIKKLWQAVGARVEILNPAVHDKILASVSHLPHVAAFSLIKTIPAKYLRFSSRGLKDTTRIASSDPELWRDIFLMNAKNILKVINDLEINLKVFKRLIARKDRQGLMKLIEQAKLKRDYL